jgi:hypothetical protein
MITAPPDAMPADDPADGIEDAATVRAARWGTLPDRIRPEQLVEEVRTEPARDPDGGQDPNRDWMLRYG